jgi:cold shock protein
MAEPIQGTGRVKFFRAEKGWGGIESPDVPADIWVHFSAIAGSPGEYRALHKGQRVEFICHPARQDSWSYVADWVKPLPPDDPN